MDYTANFGMKLPKRGVDRVKVDDLNDNTEDIDTLIHQNRTMIAPAFDSAKAYVVGDPVCYLGELFVFIADKAAGAWDAAKVEPTTAAEMGGGGASALADLDDVEITNPSTGQALLFDDDDDVWKNQNLPDVSVTKEASGNPIEITDAANAPLVKCVTEIQGSQDLHGYDKPWVGGAGKNKLPQTTTGTLTINGITFTPNDDGSVKVTGTATGTANYSYITTNASSPLKAGNWRAYASGLSNVRFVIGGSQSSITGITLLEDGYTDFTLANDNDTLGYCTIQVVSGVTVNSTVYLMITSQNESSTFQPYSNICPITAYTEGEIEVSDGDGNITTHTTTYPSAIYRGSEDVVNGTATTEWGMIASYAGETLPGEWISDRDEYAPGTTPTTGAQVAYELATPTTSSVTPTNLPIKSLSGYNHIESSTGEMEVEYISGNYQALVDLIQSSSHVYSTAEQIVGKWTDGKDLFEKTIVIQNFSASTADSGWYYGTVDLSDYGINPERLFPQQGETFIILQDTTPRIPIYIDWQGGTNLYLYFLGSRSGTLTVVVRYTKVTVSRSLSAPLTSQKAQIEPLSEKEEEIPVEEEKAVEKPVEEPETEEKSDER